MNRSYIYMTIAALCWAGAFIAGKIGGAVVSGVEMSFYRFAVAVVCLFIYGEIKKTSFRLPLRKALVIMLIGIFGMVGYHLLFFAALLTIDVLESSSINTLNPLLSALLGFLIFSEPMNRKGLFFSFDRISRGSDNYCEVGFCSSFFRWIQYRYFSDDSCHGYMGCLFSLNQKTWLRNIISCFNFLHPFRCFAFSSSVYSC